ncbi:MAG: adenosylcobinamide-GDP ribazoletransferase [Lachnospiraceae bacterium]
MISLFKGCVVAFSMYSTIPMPKIDWNKNSMKYMLLFFPFVGVVIGAITYMLHHVMMYFQVSQILYSCIMVVHPILLSGAIHLDGFIDTCDARYSRQELEKKLEILKDPHVGAFGVIATCVLLLMQVGIYAQFYENSNHIILLCFVPTLARCLSALSIVSFKTAKKTGLVHLFSNHADKKKVKVVLWIETVIVLVVLLVLNLTISLVLIGVVFLWFLFYSKICFKEFGGITGDLAGFFLIICELLALITITLGANI